MGTQDYDELALSLPKLEMVDEPESYIETVKIRGIVGALVVKQDAREAAQPEFIHGVGGKKTH